MSLMTTIQANAKRGPRLDPDRETRQRHIEVAYRMLTSRLSVRQIAAFYGVSRQTCYVWRDLALTYSDPEADRLRELKRKLDRGAC